MLRADMAKRIMYSILPSVCDSAQIFHTQGVVDYKALSAACEGRRSIIKFGTKACMREANHYTKKSDTFTNELSEEFTKGNYFYVILRTTQVFADKFGWNSSFGGEAWFQISNSILKILSYDEELEKVVKAKNTCFNFWETSIEIMKSIVIEMNVLDGLAHNTDSIMKNLVNEEASEYSTSTGQEFEKIKKLMDAKELSNAIDVYRCIEHELIESGDIVRYRDWTKKIRNTRDYNCPLDTTEEFFKIRFRKSTNMAVSKLNTIVDDAKIKIAMMAPEPPTPYQLFENKTNNTLSWLDILMQSIVYSKDVAHLNSKKSEVSRKLYDMTYSLHSNVNDLRRRFNTANIEYTDIMNDAGKIEKLHESIGYINQIVYMVSSV